MAKGVKKIAKDSNRNSRYKEESYIRGEDRKKLNRRINRIKNDIATGKVKGNQGIQEANTLIKFLEQLKSETYIDRKTGKYQYPLQRLHNTIEYATRRRDEIVSISEETLQASKNARQRQKLQERKNEIFQRELNAAGRESDISVSSITKAEMKIFYAATMDVWKQVSDWKYRNQAIMEHFETKSLEEAFQKVMAMDEAKDALERAKTEQEPEKGVSPEYIEYLIAVLDR